VWVNAKKPIPGVEAIKKVDTTNIQFLLRLSEGNFTFDDLQ
jgi:hypothetical protein